MLRRIITDSDFYSCKREYILEINRYTSRGILINELDNVAIMYMSKNGFYKLPGGGIEDGETEQQAFIREIKEETGRNCEIILKLGILEEHKNKNAFFQYSHCFYAKVVGDITENNLTDNEKQLGLKLEWFSIEEAIKIVGICFRKCNDYGFRFMLLRDLNILQYVYSEIKNNDWIKMDR